MPRDIAGNIEEEEEEKEDKESLEFDPFAQRYSWEHRRRRRKKKKTKKV